MKTDEPHISRSTLFLFAFVCAATVANIYYSQPLLAELARYFKIDETKVGWIASLSQLGYAVGVFCLVPLGDIYERKKLILILTVLLSLSLLSAALAPSFWFLMIACTLVGVTTIIPQILFPYAATLAAPKKRASAIGTIQSGLLIGILLARTFSGAIAEASDWRRVYFVATFITLAIAVVIAKSLKKQSPSSRLSYRELISSMAKLFLNEPKLRWVSISGAFNFAVFSVFWTTLAFLLEKNFHYGPGVTGLFGIIGVAGALTASFAGQFSDRRGTRLTQYLSEFVTLLSFFIFAGAGHSIALLIVGIVVLDAGVQAQHIACQADILSLRADARSRLNGIYMFVRFAGGAMGSTAGAYAWRLGGWKGVALAGTIFGALSILATAFAPKSAAN